MLEIPAILNGEHYVSIDTQPIVRIGGGRVARLTLTPMIKIHEVLRSAPGKLLEMQQIPSSKVFAAFRSVAALLRGDDWSFCSMSKRDYCVAVSECTGYPAASMPAEIEDMARMLDQMESIVRVQLPDGTGASLDTHCYMQAEHPIGYYPAGRSLLVRVPGNVPTICVYWLVPLALKRPVILVPPHDDPFTHRMLVDAIRSVAPWLAAYVQFLPCTEQVFAGLLHQVDQVIMSQSLLKLVQRSHALSVKTHFIHYGRSKLLIQGHWNDEVVEVALRRMHWNHGRTCTGLTSIIVTESARALCTRMAERIARQLGEGFDENLDRLPVFDLERAKRLDQTIESFIERGDAQDVTRTTHGQPRLLAQGVRAMLLPTVLWVKDARSPVFGMELPFPFVTVVEGRSEEELLELSRDSLILSTIGVSVGLLERLCHDSSIRKVFSGPYVERGYHPLDPHEGYMADFLYHKKAVLPACDERSSMPQ